jgi:glutamate/aspartate transport system substrate-binding protein
MKAFFTVVSALILLASPLSAAELAGTLKEIKDSGTIRIGYRQSEPPMSFVDESGKPVGYSVDLCLRIANAVKAEVGATDIKVEYVPVNAADRFTALADNKIDILCGSTTKTLARSKLVDFTQLTFVTGASLLSLEGGKVAAIADLQGKKVGVVKGTTTIDVLKGALKDSLTEAEVVPVDSASDAINSLLTGKIDAFSSDQVVLIGLVLTSQNRGDLVISTDLFSFEPFALAVRRNDADFRLVADRVLSHLYRSGQVMQIYRKWFSAFSKKPPVALGALYQLNATPE